MQEQKLRPGEKIDMPVFFYIDPEFATDPKMTGINTITLRRGAAGSGCPAATRRRMALAGGGPRAAAVGMRAPRTWGLCSLAVPAFYHLCF